MGMTIDESKRNLSHAIKWKDRPTDESMMLAIETISKYQQLKADYETRLKADMETMLKRLYGELKMMHERYSTAEHWDEAYGIEISMEEVRKKINDLRRKDGNIGEERQNEKSY